MKILNFSTPKKGNGIVRQYKKAKNEIRKDTVVLGSEWTLLTGAGAIICEGHNPLLGLFIPAAAVDSSSRVGRLSANYDKISKLKPEYDKIVARAKKIYK